MVRSVTPHPGNEMAFQKILVPVDFSETSLHALRLAIDLARQGGGKVSLIHIGTLPLVVSDAAAYGAAVPAYLIEARDQITQEQRHALERLAEEEVPAEFLGACVVREGYPPDEIVEESQSGGYDLLVMGTHGRQGVARLMLGSVAERVIRGAAVPVLVTH